MPAPRRAPEPGPSGAPRIRLTVRFASGAPGRAVETLEVPAGTTVRELLGRLGVPVEGSAVWWSGDPVPMDLPLRHPGEVEVVSTFSGG